MTLAPSAEALAAQLRQGEVLVKALHPGELAEVLGGRAWVCGLLTTARAIRGLEAAPTARALGLPPGRLGPDASLLLLELRLPPDAVETAVRIARERITGPLQQAVTPLRRADGSLAGVYRGTGRGPAPWEVPELIAGAPLAIPPGARLLRRHRQDRVLAQFNGTRWVPARPLPPLEGAYVQALCASAQAPPPLRAACEGPGPDPFSFSLPTNRRDEILACLAPGVRFVGVEERLARFDWMQVDSSDLCQTWQHASGVFLEVWLREGRIREAQLIEGEEAQRMDAPFGAWHRQGRPLVDMADNAELRFTEGEAPGPVTLLELAPDGWAWLMRSDGGVERRWAGRVEPEARARVFAALRRSGFPRSNHASAPSRLTLAADGRSQSAPIPESGAYASVLAELRALQHRISAPNEP